MFSWQACQLGKMPRCSHWRHFTWRRPVFYHPAHGRESWALQEVPTVGQIGKQLASVTSVPTGKTEGEWYFHETNTARRINWFIHIIGEMPKFPVQIELVETTQKRHRNKYPPPPPPPLQKKKKNPPLPHSNPWTHTKNKKKPPPPPPPPNHLENIIHFPPFTNENPWASEKSRSINYPTVFLFHRPCWCGRWEQQQAEPCLDRHMSHRCCLCPVNCCIRSDSWGEECFLLEAVTVQWPLADSPLDPSNVHLLCAPMVSACNERLWWVYFTLLLLYSNPPILSLLKQVHLNVFLSLHL